MLPLYTVNEARDIITNYVVTTLEAVEFTRTADVLGPDWEVLGVRCRGMDVIVD